MMGAEEFESFKSAKEFESFKGTFIVWYVRGRDCRRWSMV